MKIPKLHRLCKTLAAGLPLLMGMAGCTTPAPPPQCFWMENHSGKFNWVPASTMYRRLLTKKECFEQDSCDGGMNGSNGGCYKWATSPSATRQPW